MCGIVGIFSHQPVAEALYDSLIHLQHRGQDAAGIVTSHEAFSIKQGLGLIREIFKEDDLLHMKGHYGIGHTRYPTAGGQSLQDVQPLVVDKPRAIALAHNGNLTNHQALRDELIRQNVTLHASTDSEVLLYLLENALGEVTPQEGNEALFFEKICAAVQVLFDQAKGSFSVVATLLGKGLLIFRDPHGIRPLVMGERMNAKGLKEYIFASENTMFYPLEFQQTNDVMPAQVIFINEAGRVFSRQLNAKRFTPCIFEYVYFARPDSTLDKVGVYQARIRMGEMLALRWREKYPDLLPDVVVPAPFTSNTAAKSFAESINVRYVEGLYKNPFIGRTFIMSGAQTRKKQIRYKLSPQSSEIQGKKVLILDDSIVRGTTSREIVKMLREHEADKVYFVSASPPISEPCYFGIDIPSRKELIAANYTEAQIAEELGVDCLLYQELDDLIEAIFGSENKTIDVPCIACMKQSSQRAHPFPRKRQHHLLYDQQEFT